MIHLRTKWTHGTQCISHILPSSSSRWVARYICLSFWSCFSIFLLASLCAFSSFRWSSVLLLPRQPIFPPKNTQKNPQWFRFRGEAGLNGWLVVREEGRVLIRSTKKKKKSILNSKTGPTEEHLAQNRWHLCCQMQLQTDVELSGSRRWGSTGALAQFWMDGWMWLFTGDFSTT